MWWILHSFAGLALIVHMRECKKSGNAGDDTSELTRGGVLHYGLDIYIKKYLKAKEEELWKIQIFHRAKIY